MPGPRSTGVSSGSQPTPTVTTREAATPRKPMGRRRPAKDDFLSSRDDRSQESYPGPQPDQQLRQLSLSRSVIGQVIPTGYGTFDIGASLGDGIVYDDTTAAFQFPLLLGEYTNNGIYINGEDIDDLDWVTNYEFKSGSTSQTVSTIMSALIGSSYKQAFPGLCYVVVQIDRKNAKIPSGLNVTANVTRNDLPHFSGSGTDSSDKIAMAAYDILTNKQIWKLGFSNSVVNQANWSAFDTWASYVLGDSSKRFAINGPIYTRDQESALRDLLWHGMAEPARDFDTGEIFIIAKRPQTETGDTIEADEWIGEPEVSQIPPDSVPNLTYAWYTNSDESGSRDHAISEADDATAEGVIDANFEFPMCTVYSQAKRSADHKRLTMSLESFTWSGYIRRGLSNTMMGDVIEITTPDLEIENQKVRVKQLDVIDDNTYYGVFEEYDINAQSDSVETGDTPVSRGSGWGTENPDTPSAAVQNFEYGGSWYEHCLMSWYGIDSEADKITSPNWTYSAMGGAWDGTESSMAPNGTPAGTLTSDTFTVNSDYVLVTCLVRLYGNTTNRTWTLELHDSVGLIDDIVLNDDDTEYDRVVFIAPAGTGNHFLRFAVTSGTHNPPCGIYVRRVFVIDLDYGQPLSLTEHWSWTPHVDESDTVESYQFGFERYDENGIFSFTSFKEVPAGGPSNIRATIFDGGLARWEVGYYKEKYQSSMRTLGLNGIQEPFPTPTQNVVKNDYVLPVRELSSVDNTNEAAGAALVKDSLNDGEEWVAQGSLKVVATPTVDDVPKMNSSGQLLASGVQYDDIMTLSTNQNISGYKTFLTGRLIIKGRQIFEGFSTLTISAGGVISPVYRIHYVRSIDANPDDVDTISVVGTTVGDVRIFMLDYTSAQVTFKDGTGNLHLGSDRVLDNQYDIIELLCLGSQWILRNYWNNA